MGITARPLIRLLDPCIWPLGDTGGVDGDSGDAEGGGEGGGGGAGERGAEHSGTFPTVTAVRKPGILISGKTDISPASQSGRLSPS